MRIGIITGEYPPMQGGVGAYTHILAGELAQQGHEIYILSSTQAQNSTANPRLDNSIARWDIGSLRTINRWARHNQLEVVNLQFQTAAYQMSPWIHLLPDGLRDIPIVITFHDLRYPYLFPKAGPLRPWIVNHLAQRSSGVIVTNHEDGKRLQYLPRTALIPIGSNIRQTLPEDFSPAAWRRQAGAQSDDFLLAYFGLFNRSKGLETLLTTLANLRAAGVPTRLVLVGGGSGSSDPTNAAYMEEMNAQIARLQLEPFIHRTGYLEDETSVGAYLAASDAVVLPFLDGASYRRGSLMAAIHYSGAIVTTTPQVNIPTFRDSENMLLVPPGNSAALQSALLRLRQSLELRERLRQGAAKLADEFRWDTIAQHYLAFFERIIQESP